MVQEENIFLFSGSKPFGSQKHRVSHQKPRKTLTMIVDSFSSVLDPDISVTFWFPDLEKILFHNYEHFQTFHK